MNMMEKVEIVKFYEIKYYFKTYTLLIEELDNLVKLRNSIYNLEPSIFSKNKNKIFLFFIINIIYLMAFLALILNSKYLYGFGYFLCWFLFHSLLYKFYKAKKDFYELKLNKNLEEIKTTIKQIDKTLERDIEVSLESVQVQTRLLEYIDEEKDGLGILESFEGLILYKNASYKEKKEFIIKSELKLKEQSNLLKELMRLEHQRLEEERKLEAKRLEDERLEHQRLEKIRLEDERLEEEIKLNNSPLYNYFEAVEGGETTFYYLKLQNKFGERRYKFGVTLSSVKERYPSKFHDSFEILYEKRLTHARSIEKAISNKFKHLITDESLIGTTGTEIVKEDVLRMDV